MHTTVTIAQWSSGRSTRVFRPYALNSVFFLWVLVPFNKLLVNLRVNSAAGNTSSRDERQNKIHIPINGVFSKIIRKGQLKFRNYGHQNTSSAAISGIGLFLLSGGNFWTKTNALTSFQNRPPPPPPHEPLDPLIFKHLPRQPPRHHTPLDLRPAYIKRFETQQLTFSTPFPHPGFLPA